MGEPELVVGVTLKFFSLVDIYTLEIKEQMFILNMEIIDIFVGFETNSRYFKWMKYKYIYQITKYKV